MQCCCSCPSEARPEHTPAPSLMTELSLELKRTSTWFRMNSTTTDWIRTSMKAAVPLKHADSICLDLQGTPRQGREGKGHSCWGTVGLQGLGLGQKRLQGSSVGLKGLGFG